MTEQIDSPLPASEEAGTTLPAEVVSNAKAAAAKTVQAAQIEAKQKILRAELNGLNKLHRTETKPKKDPRLEMRDALKDRWRFRMDLNSGRRYVARAGVDNPFGYKQFDPTDDTINGICLELAENGLVSSTGLAQSVICTPQVSRPINMTVEQLDYLEREYKGLDPLADLIACCDTDDSELFMQLFTKWLVSVVAQVYDNFKRNDYAFVFVGEQGCGKTGFFERLLWRREHFVSPATAYNFSNKEHMMLLTTHTLVLLDEMSAYSKKADLNQLKAAFSQSEITTDPKFKNTTTFPRRGSFAGTTNHADFLRDDTGDRRFLVFTLHSYDQKRFNAIDKMQLWGQLTQMYKAGFNTLLTQEEIRQNIARNLANYSMEKIEEYFIERYFVVTGDKKDFVSNAEMFCCEEEFNKALSGKRFGLSRSTINNRLRMIGVKPNHSKRTGNSVEKGYQGLALLTEMLLESSKPATARGAAIIEDMDATPVSKDAGSNPSLEEVAAHQDLWEREFNAATPSRLATKAPAASISDSWQDNSDIESL